MNNHFSCDELGHIWGISPTKVTQARQPWLEKAVKLWRADPGRFMRMLLEADQQLIFEDEWLLRRDIQRGRVNRADLQPVQHPT